MNAALGYPLVMIIPYIYCTNATFFFICPSPSVSSPFVSFSLLPYLLACPTLMFSSRTATGNKTQQTHTAAHTGHTPGQACNGSNFLHHLPHRPADNTINTHSCSTVAVGDTAVESVAKERLLAVCLNNNVCLLCNLVL